MHRTLLVSLILLSMATSCWGATFITTTAIDARLAERDVLLAINDRSTKEMDMSALKPSLANKAAEKTSLVRACSLHGTLQGPVAIR